MLEIKQVILDFIASHVLFVVLHWNIGFESAFENTFNTGSWGSEKFKYLGSICTYSFVIIFLTML